LSTLILHHGSSKFNLRDRPNGFIFQPMTNKMYSTSEVARACGISRKTVQVRHLSHNVGRLVGNSLVFTAEEMLLMMDWPHKQGRPWKAQ
jgi:hypothetical protein